MKTSSREVGGDGPAARLARPGVDESAAKTRVWQGVPLSQKLRCAALKLSLGALALSAGVAAHGAQFFRIAGPVRTTITALSADGHITWTNPPTNATFIVQTAHSLPGQTNWVDYVQVPVTNAVTTQRICDPSPPSGMALIPAGSYIMGDTFGEGNSDELPLHTNYVSAFYMDTNLVTYTFWTNVYQWATNHGFSFDYAGRSKAANHPVGDVCWYDVVKWCNARSEMEGLTPCYYTNTSRGQMTIYRSGQVALGSYWVSWVTNGYRLPTEAEWEKAARGGLSGQRFPWGNTISESQANYCGVTNYSYDLGPNGYNAAFATGGYPYTSPVGYLAPNGYGLYDIAGNVWEWCWDRYWIDYYSSSPGTDPRGPGSGPSRLYRGGSWDEDAFSCRPARRHSSSPTYCQSKIGFRSVRPAGQ